ncbi:hypothetical protein [Mycobacterium neglectum]|uniref:hypothetical protein n=1 Tax=Mycobacterium neglectum TaxID=242737 RepID=UPI000BFECE30|nr:hypothetical protein [Mycobacterium neglectum]
MTDQDGSETEPATEPIYPVAAVIDTCFFGAGNFKPDSVEKLASRLARRDVELWVPGQVIDEWAIHAFEAFKDLQAAYTKLGHLTIAGDPPPPLTARDVAAHIDQLCRAIPNVKVLDLDGQCAVDAIRDQVLGEGAGGRSKDGTRTGAVDSSIVRDTLRRVDNDPDQIVFLTKNIKDFRPAVIALGHSGFVSANTTHQLFGKLSAPVHPKHDAGTARRLIIDDLLESITEAAAADDRHGPPPAWINVDDITVNKVDSDDRREFDELIDPEFELEPAAELVYVANVSLQVIDEDTDLVSYTVVLLADVRAEGYVINNDGNAVHEWMILYESIVTVPFDADIVDGKLLQPRQSDSATVHAGRPRFADEWDAYQDVLDTITGWDGISFTPATPAKDGLPTSFELRGPEGQRIDGEVSGGSIAGEWTLEFSSPEMELTAEISSEYDANSRVWLGRDDSFDMYPPISLVSGARRARSGPYPALAGVWQYLVDRKNQPARDEETDEEV